MRIIIHTLVFLYAFAFGGVIDSHHTTTILILVLISIGCYKKKLPFNNFLIAIAICLLVNFLLCNYYRGQEIFTTLKGTSSILLLFLYWFFYRWKIDIQTWEKYIYNICLVFCICYMIQYLTFPKIIFGGQIRTYSEEARVSIYGQGLASLSVLYGINKFIVHHSLKYIALCLLGLFAVFGCGYRSIVLSLVISICLMLVFGGFSKKKIFSFFSVALLLYFFIQNVDFVQQQIGNMTARNESMKEQGLEDNIRYVNFLFHYTSYFKSPIELIFGSGMPYKGSQYNSFIDKMNEYHYYYQDLGLIGLSWMIGIPTVLLMVCYSIKIFRTKLPMEYLYIRIYFIQILLSSITAHEFYFQLNFVVQAILMCVFAHVIKCRTLKNCSSFE